MTTVTLDSIRSKIGRGEPTETESTQDQQTDDGASGAWRRGLVGASVMLAAGVYLQRRRSGPESQRRAVPADEQSDRSTSRSGPARMGGRRLKSLVISTVVFTLARRVVRRVRASR